MLYDIIKVEIDVLVAKYKVASEDGKLSLSEIWALTQQVAAAAIKVAESLGGTGEEKKANVMEALARFYDEVVAPIDIRPIPNIFEPAFDRFAKELFLSLVDGAIDALVSILYNKPE